MCKAGVEPEQWMVFDVTCCKCGMLITVVCPVGTEETECPVCLTTVPKDPEEYFKLKQLLYREGTA